MEKGEEISRNTTGAHLYLIDPNTVADDTKLEPAPKYRLKSLSDWLIIGMAGFDWLLGNHLHNFLAAICFPWTIFRLTNHNVLRGFFNQSICEFKRYFGDDP